MSFSFFAQARSRPQALKLIQSRSDLPQSVRDLLETAVRNIGPQSGQELRAIKISATGHVAASSGDYSQTNATIEVSPIFVPED